MVTNLELQDAVIKKRLEVDERPLKKLARRVIHVVRHTQSTDHALEKQALRADFQSYEHTLKRISLLSKANVREMERYESEKQHVRQIYARAESDLTCLRDQLDHEQKSRNDRGFFDTLALDIQSSTPKSRRSQQLIIMKLEQEVAELEAENANYNVVWQTRKSGFDDIMARLATLQREILGEKADAELRDAAESDEEEGAVSVHESLAAPDGVESPRDGRKTPIEKEAAQKGADDKAATVRADQKNDDGGDIMDTS